MNTPITPVTAYAKQQRRTAALLLRLKESMADHARSADPRTFAASGELSALNSRLTTMINTLDEAAIDAEMLG